MGNETLDEIIGNFSDGSLTKREFQKLMKQVGTNRDYIGSTDAHRLIGLLEKEGAGSLTKYQFVQCREAAIEMKFIYYNPRKLIPLLKERGINFFSYKVCSGCVLTNISPDYCFHPEESFEAPSVQSDLLCPHCFITAEETGEPFPLIADENLNQKINELEKILELASL